MKGNSGRKLMTLILFLTLLTALLAPLSVRSATADTVLPTVTVGSCPLAVAVNPVTNRVYTVNNDNVRYTVTVIDGATTSVSQKPINFTVGQNFYTAGGQSIDMDVSPFISNGRAFVPARFLADALGAQTSWDATTRTVTLTKGDTTIGMTIRSATLTVNGATSWSDVAPMIRDGRTFLPGRWVAEALGCTVSWDEATQTMTVLPSST
jgi:hypothetical protein